MAGSRRAAAASAAFDGRGVVGGTGGAVSVADSKARRRAWCLHRKLQPVVLRRPTSVLAPILPPKTDITLRLALSPAQRAFYGAMVGVFRQLAESGPGFLPLFAVYLLQLLAAHPAALLCYVRGRGRGLPAVADGAATAAAAAAEGGGGATDSAAVSFPGFEEGASEASGVAVAAVLDALTPVVNALVGGGGGGGAPGGAPVLPAGTIAAVSSGCKFDAVCELVDLCARTGERMLVFTRSLVVLHTLHHVLAARYGPAAVLRFDGTTPAAERYRIIERFNRVDGGGGGAPARAETGGGASGEVAGGDGGGGGGSPAAGAVPHGFPFCMSPDQQPASPPPAAAGAGAVGSRPPTLFELFLDPSAGAAQQPPPPPPPPSAPPPRRPWRLQPPGCCCCRRARAPRA